MQKEQPIARTAKGLRNALFDELQDLRAGKGDLKRAAQVANLANAIMKTVAVELDYMRYVDREDPPLKSVGELELGDVGSDGAPAITHEEKPGAKPETGVPASDLASKFLWAVEINGGTAGLSEIMSRVKGNWTRREFSECGQQLVADGVLKLRGANYAIA